MPDSFADYRVDRLFLLVGSNPLPNFVAGKLLVNPNGAITLLHTKETEKIAEKLEKKLKEIKIPTTLKEMDDTDPSSIIKVVQEALIGNEKLESIGLNYTGGTKTMAVHTYRTIKDWATNKRINSLSFSYLDARNLNMVFDPKALDGIEQSKVLSTRNVFNLTLQELIDLHGWRIKENPITQPILLNVAQSIAKVCEFNYREWKSWISDALNRKCKYRGRLLDMADLDAVSIDLPTHRNLVPFVTALQNELQTRNTSFVLGDAARQLNFSASAVAGKESEEFFYWLDGKWLESFTLQALRDCQSRISQSNPSYQLKDIRMNFKPETDTGTNSLDDFELDVVAMQGYQLFAISCSTSKGGGQDPGGRAILKRKLFEIITRARQLGGDAARVALVCYSDSPQNIEDTAYSLMPGLGRIKVFSARDIPQLSQKLEQWIK
ncbi:MAG: DUF1887 family protein [Acidobacteria bacterium]|nr:DUF1887 family protein [Acidobacteriota bacterium]